MDELTKNKIKLNGYRILMLFSLLSLMGVLVFIVVFIWGLQKY